MGMLGVFADVPLSAEKSKAKPRAKGMIVVALSLLALLSLFAAGKTGNARASASFAGKRDAKENSTVCRTTT